MNKKHFSEEKTFFYCILLFLIVGCNPGLRVQKIDQIDLGVDGVLSIGDTITYVISIENTGNVELSGLELVDANAQLESISCGTPLPSTLGVGEINNCEAIHIITKDDLINQSVSNSAVVSGSYKWWVFTSNYQKISDDPDNPTSSEDPTITDLALSEPTLIIELTGEIQRQDDGILNEGDLITYSMDVINVSDEPVTNIELLNSSIDFTGCFPFNLDGGQTKTCTTEIILTPSDLTKKAYTAEVAIQGTNADNILVDADDELTINLDPILRLEVEVIDNLLVDNQNVVVGDEISYEIKISNRGNTAFKIENVIGTSNTTNWEINQCLGFGLLGGEDLLCTGIYRVNANDINSKFVKTSFTVSATAASFDTLFADISDDLANNTNIDVEWDGEPDDPNFTHLICQNANGKVLCEEDSKCSELAAKSRTFLPDQDILFLPQEFTGPFEKEKYYRDTFNAQETINRLKKISVINTNDNTLAPLYIDQIICPCDSSLILFQVNPDIDIDFNERKQYAESPDPEDDEFLRGNFIFNSKPFDEGNVYVDSKYGDNKPPNVSNPRATIAIIDSGIDVDHSFYRNALWKINERLPPCSILDMRKGGLDVYSYLYKNVTIAPVDLTGHGTHITGIASANTENVKILSLKITNNEKENNKADMFSLLCATKLAIKAGVDVINLSFGWYAAEFDPILYEMFKLAESNDIMIVTSAGNDSIDTDCCYHWPSGFSFMPNLNNVLSVGSINDDNQIAAHSNIGNSTTQIFARGVDVISTYLNNSCIEMTGTSMAAPFVTRRLAQMKSLDPSLSIEELKQQLVDPTNGQNFFDCSLETALWKFIDFHSNVCSP